jgi:hypothetical protein
MILMTQACKGGSFFITYFALDNSATDPKNQKRVQESEAWNKIQFIMAEDAPQVIIQTVNIMLNGTSLDWLQAATPVLGIFSIIIGLRT